jgi:eukaryotic-like serine/threonine-protein kinase
MNPIRRIELKCSWELGQEIGRGGFGRVHEAEGEDNKQAVIKLIPKMPDAARELLFEPIAGFTNVIPVIDTGEWQNYYVLVMPRAEKSLRQRLNESGEKLSLEETIQILLDVADALASLQGNVVHRDLKPENILLYQHHWCLADFGIARYAEATTAPDTHKYTLSIPYAAPEQWKHERATSASDVYAFGIMAFELLQGLRPFQGPDFREQHLKHVPPHLTSCPPAIASLVTECLYKAPQARPTPANILTRLRASQRPSSPAVAQLQVANQVIVNKQAGVQADASAQQSTAEQRKGLFVVAQQSLEIIRERFIEDVLNAASAASVSKAPYLLVHLGDAQLSIDSIQPTPPNCLVDFNGQLIFDVIAHTSITVHKPRDQFGYEGRSHSLWFCDAHDEGVFRWFETAFMVGVFIPLRSVVNPFALPPTDKKAMHAFSSGMSERQIAWEPLPFDQGNEDQFIERWLEWFAGAVNGALHNPSQMPENSGGRHRGQR